MDLQANVLRQLKNRREGFSLEQPFYIDQDYFKLDMEMIWYRDWLFIGHDCEIPRAGNYFTAQIGDYPVVIVRGKDQVIRAFHNTCRHRGHRVCTQDRGASAKLVCPYHQWTYDLDGSLVFARQMGETFDKSEFGLKTVHCESVAGYIFICLANGSGLPLLADPDSHWHIAVGNWMLAHGTVPTVDTFSFTFAGQPWIAKEWLSQLLMSVAFKLGGWGGVTVLAAAALAVSFAMMLRLLLRDLRPLPAAVFGRHHLFEHARHVVGAVEDREVAELLVL